MITRQLMLGWWGNSTVQVPMGDLRTYELAARWLDGHGDVADWGGGTGFAGRYFKQSGYTNIDGSHSPDRRVNLFGYHEPSPCILMRHVIEHNLDWPVVLKNALGAFSKRMVLVTFMPWAARTHIARWDTLPTGVTVPYISFAKSDLLALVTSCLVALQEVGEEHVFYLEKETDDADMP